MHEDDIFNQQDAEPLSLARLADVLRRYAGIIVISLAAVAAAYAAVAALILLTSERQTVTSMPFRLEFKGAERGEYPNGLKFSVSDITATPILLEVWENNQLSRFVGFDRFNRSLFVLESNRELDQLTAEYQTRLADAKLTPVDRERIEREFEQKRASISKSDYALQIMQTGELRKVPQPIVAKVLDDILRGWARRAAVEKKALHFNKPILSAAVVSEIERESTDPLIRLLLLRRRMEDVLANIELLAEEVPGANLVRTSAKKLSLAELQLSLDELMRFRLEPMIVTARATGLVSDPAATLRILRAQLAYDERAHAAALAREAALHNALRLYESHETSPLTQMEGQAAARQASPEDRPERREAVMPQLSEGFLDRIVAISGQGADREYRQRLTDDIRKASLAVIPLASSVEYDRAIIAALESSAVPPDPAASARFSQMWDRLIADVRETVRNVNEIYVTASRLLYPETELYRILGPPSTSRSGAVSLARLALGGVLTLLVALVVILVAVFVHNSIRRQSTTVASTAEETV